MHLLRLSFCVSSCVNIGKNESTLSWWERLLSPMGHCSLLDVDVPDVLKTGRVYPVGTTFVCLSSRFGTWFFALLSLSRCSFKLHRSEQPHLAIFFHFVYFIMIRLHKLPGALAIWFLSELKLESRRDTHPCMFMVELVTSQDMEKP